MFTILKSRRSHSNLCILFLVILTFYYYFPNSNIKNDAVVVVVKVEDKPKNPSLDAWNKFNSCQGCLAGAFRNIMENDDEDFRQIWKNISNIIGNCCEESFKNFHFDALQNKNYTKYILQRLNPSAGCHVITLGIGNDTLVEEQMFKKNPLCTFLGVDPHLNNGGFEYMQLGDFIEATVVGAKNQKNYDGTRNLENINKTSSAAIQQQKRTSFQQILKKHFFFDKIDYLFMNIGGEEYEIFYDLVENYPIYPTICQLNIIFHFPSKKSSKNNLKIFNFLYKSIIEKLYLPLHADFKAPFNNHFYLFNFNDSFCLRKYLNFSI